MWFRIDVENRMRNVTPYLKATRFEGFGRAGGWLKDYEWEVVSLMSLEGAVKIVKSCEFECSSEH